MYFSFYKFGINPKPVKSIPQFPMSNRYDDVIANNSVCDGVNAKQCIKCG